MIMHLFVRTIAILITSYITKVGVPVLPVYTTGVTAFLVAVALAIINVTIKPVIAIASIPINLITLGLFSFVINGAMVYLASLLVKGFFIPNIWYGILFAFVLSLVNWVLHILE